MKRETIHNKFNGHCAYCGAEITIKEMQIDHIISKNLFKQYVHNKFQIPYFLNHLTESDVNHIDNLFPSCKYCNNYKNSNDLEYFRKMLNIMLNEKHEYLFKSKSKMQIAINMGCLNIKKWDGVFYFETLIKN